MSDMSELPQPSMSGSGPGPSQAPDRDLIQPEDVGVRVDRHERGSRRVHFFLGLGLLLLALLLGRGIYENFLLRQGNQRLSDAVEKQSLQLSQVGSVEPVLGSGFAEPGTVLVGPDGKEYVCVGKDGTGAAAGEGGEAGTAGGAGEAGTSGGAGSSGAVGAIGATGAQGATGATGSAGAQGPAGNVAVIDMDDTY